MASNFFYSSVEKFLLKNHQSFIIKKEKINNLLSPNSAVITKVCQGLGGCWKDTQLFVLAVRYCQCCKVTRCDQCTGVAGGIGIGEHCGGG